MMKEVLENPLLLVNGQQHTPHVQLQIFFTKFLTSVDQIFIFFIQSTEARNRPSGENDSEFTKSECFRRIRFCFALYVSNGFQMTIDPSLNPLINENENKIPKWVEK